jgi:uncharacterized protein YjbI with pentapeptide repeats
MTTVATTHRSAPKDLWLIPNTSNSFKGRTGTNGGRKILELFRTLPSRISKGPNSRGANLSLSDLDRTDLRAADLSEANLDGVDIRGARLIEANLERASLIGAYLRGLI